jgi:hypothetical protein
MSRNSSAGYIRNSNTGGAGTAAAVTEAGTQQDEEQKQTYRFRNRYGRKTKCAGSGIQAKGLERGREGLGEGIVVGTQVGSTV